MAPRYCANCCGDMVLPESVPQFVEALALLRECVGPPAPFLRARIDEFLARHGGGEAAQRIAEMRAKGHAPPSEEDAQATFDATLAAMEREGG